MTIYSETASMQKTVGVAMNVLAASSITLCGIIIKHSQLGGNVASFGIGILGLSLGLITYLIFYTTPISPSDFIKTFLSGFFCSGLFNFLYFLSLDYITVADANAVAYFPRSLSQAHSSLVNSYHFADWLNRTYLHYTIKT